MKTIVFFFILIFASLHLLAGNGHKLWLRYKNTGIVNIVCPMNSATISIAGEELKNGWRGKDGASFALTIKQDKEIKGDGFRISKNGIQANTELGILYGVYEVLRRQYTGESIEEEICNPSYERRILDHWDNLNGTIERGYAGLSIFW